MKYRRKVFSARVEETLKLTCLGISERYEIHFVEIGMDEDHVHFLIQSIPTLAPSRIVQIIKNITAKEIYRNNPEVKKHLWGGHLWTAGYYINTVGASGSESVIRTYVEQQGKKYQQLLSNQFSFLNGLH